MSEHTVEELMNPYFTCLSPLTTVKACSVMMEAQDSDCVLVSDETGLMGILTDRDIRKAMARNLDPARTQVKEVMTTGLVMASPDTTVSEAVFLMFASGIRHLPVVDGDSPVGIVTLSEILRGVGQPYGRFAMKANGVAG